VRDPGIVSLRGRVTAEVDRSIAEDQVEIAITTTDGKRLQKRIEHAIGSAKNPMSDAQLEAKYRALTDGILPPARASKLLDLCWNFAKLPRIAELARATAS
jgi:2-methylcitrate dehydratase PrpD